VTNYTQVAKLPKRLQRMIAQTRNMTIVTTRTEAEALLLEAQLIKRFRPPYNVLLRDDKSFPFILLREDHDYPQVRKHRGARRIKGQYYGPFASAGSVTSTLNALQKLFLLRSCTDGFFQSRSRPCLLYQIRRCSAPCVGRISKEDYAELVADAKLFLAGKSTGVQARLGKQMAEAAEKRDFELAAVYRDRLRALTYVQGSQTVHAEGLGDGDIFALASKAGQICIQAFFIRGGQNWGHRSFFPAHTADVPEQEVLSGFLMQFYEDVPPPRRILIDRELSEAALIAEALCERSGQKVEIAQPQRGARRKLIEQARRNAEEALERRMAESTTQGKLLQEMAEVFELRPYFEWRGMGFISQSALRIKDSYGDWDAERRFNVPGLRVTDPQAAQCGEVLKGVLKPSQCKLFGRECTPEHPVGALMVSSEGSCAAYYNYEHRKSAAFINLASTA